MVPLAALLLSLSAPAFLPAAAQDTDPAALVEPYRDRVSQILSTSLTEGRAFEMLESLCEAAPHRLSGSPGFAAAVEWARAEMTSIGLENVRLEPVLVPHWERGDVARLVVSSAPWAGTELTIVALGGSVATPVGGVTAPVVEIRDFAELDTRADEVAGAIVFYNRPMDASLFDTFAAYGGAVSQRTRGAIEAARRGAVATVVRSMTTALDDVPHTGGMRYADDVPRIPTAAVSTVDAERLSALLATGADVELTLELDCRWREDVPSANVVGEIVGSETPEEIVVVGGHLDAWDVGVGAHDDGAGCCHALEAARLLLSLDLRPRRTIRVVMFANEENGLRGGRTYRDDHADELAQHVLAVESDRGGFTPRGFTSNANPEALAILRAVVALMEGSGADRVLEGGGGADISPMAGDGVVLAGYLPDPQRYFDLHHSDNDTLDAVSDRELELGAGVIASLVYVVADLPLALPRNDG